MSRVGKSPVKIPSGVQCHLADGKIHAKGKRGASWVLVSPFVRVEINNDAVQIRPGSDTKEARAMWGTTRNLVANMMKGVHEGFVRRLEIQGVGYRASVQGTNLMLQLGFSHDVQFPIPEDVEIQCDKNSISVIGTERQRVGQVASEIRAYRKPEPYKGKGIKYEGEWILRKEGKKK